MINFDRSIFKTFKIFSNVVGGMLQSVKISWGISKKWNACTCGHYVFGSVLHCFFPFNTQWVAQEKSKI